MKGRSTTWLFLTALVSHLLMMESLTCNASTAPSSTNNGIVTFAMLRQQTEAQKKPLSAATVNSLVQSAKSPITPSFLSVQVRHGPKSPTQQFSTLSPSQQQLNSSKSQPHHPFFHHLQLRSGKNRTSFTEDLKFMLLATAQPEFTSISKGSAEREARGKSYQSQLKQQATSVRMQSHMALSNFSTPIAVNAPTQSTKSLSLNGISSISLLRNKSLKIQERRKSSHPSQHRNIIKTQERFRSKATPQMIWPSGDYCIMPGSSGICPRGFVSGSVAFAVPSDVKNDKMYRDGQSLKRYIEVGKIGGFDIGSKNFDSIYKISLTACCRIKAE